MSELRPERRGGDVTTIVGATAVAAGAFSALVSYVGLKNANKQNGDGTAAFAGGGSGGGGKGGAGETAPGGQPSSQRARTAVDPEHPTKPEGPEDLKKRSWFYVLKKVLREFGSDQCTDIAASLVYFAVLALFPGLLAIVSILGLFGQAEQTTAAVIGILQQVAPDLAGTLEPIVASLTRSPGAGIALVVGIGGAIFSASGYVGAFSRAMNRIYSIDEGRPVWKLRPTQLGVTLAIVVLVVLGALILVSTAFARQLGDALNLGDVAVTVFEIVKWPVLVGIAVLAVAILYYFSPNIRQPKFKWTSTGSIIALVIWALATVGFGFYVSQFGNYERTYGSIAGVIIFLLWLWITNLALLFGAEWDAELERGRELQAGIAAEEQIQLPPRDTRMSDKKAAKRQQDIEQGRRLRQTRGNDDGTGKKS